MGIRTKPAEQLVAVVAADYSMVCMTSPEDGRPHHSHSKQLWQPVELAGPVPVPGPVAGLEPGPSAGQWCSRTEQRSLD